MSKYPPTPEYHKKVLYNLVWDKVYHYPAIVCDNRNLTPEALKEYKASKSSTKIPIMYFCVERDELYGITSLKDIEPFSYETIFKHKKYHHTDDEIEKFQSAVTTAFEDGVDVNNLNEDNAGCCDCLKNNIDDELYSYVYCNRCMLAYHWKCEGFEKVPENAKSDDYKYVCKRCKEYFKNHPEKDVSKPKHSIMKDEYEDEDEDEEIIVKDDDDDEVFGGDEEKPKKAKKGREKKEKNERKIDDSSYKKSSTKRMREDSKEEKPQKRNKGILSVIPTKLNDNHKKGDLRKKSLLFMEKYYGSVNVEKELIKCRVNDESSFDILKNIINQNEYCLVYRSVMKRCYGLFKEIINKQRDNKEKLEEIQSFIYGLKVEYLKSEDPHLIETMYRKLDGMIKNILSPKVKEEKIKLKEEPMKEKEESVKEDKMEEEQIKEDKEKEEKMKEEKIIHEDKKPIKIEEYKRRKEEEEKHKKEEEEKMKKEEEEKQIKEEEILQVKQPETVYHKNSCKAFRQKLLAAEVNVERATVYSKLIHTLILEDLEKNNKIETMKVYLDEFMKCYRGINILTTSKTVNLLNQEKLIIKRDYFIGVMF